jgi:glycosyltransferase involved in cell wall biosynthesis
MENQQPLVSVLLIAMNHEKFIAQAAYSILNQTYKNIEVVFLDNNSKDKTFEIANEIFLNSKIKYKGIKNTENKGVSKNLNILVENANGVFISILSGDDWYELENIEKRLNFLETNNLDVVLADGYKFIEHKQKKKNVYSTKRKQRVMETIQNYYDVNLVNNITCNVGFFTKREILIKHKFDEEVHAEDWDINLRLSKEGYNFGFLNEKTFNYRILNSSLSHNVDLMRKSFMKITAKNINEIKVNPIHAKAYQLRLLEFDFLDLNKNKSNIDKKNSYEVAKKINNLKYKGLKKIYKNFILLCKNNY